MSKLTNTKAPKAATSRKSIKLVSINKTTRERKIIELFVRATILVPAEYVALLTKPGYYASVPSAEVWEGGEESKIRHWNHSVRLYSNVWVKPGKSHLAEILRMTLDTPLEVGFTARDWQRIKAVCRALGISTAEWLLASVQFNALVAMEKQAAAA